ncbi:hypothetical protein Lalb_Chr17g0348551 [Lupinus albus]|uniref:Uncharacterized protein n=1 Tax=Lupinus albus TaxID=3870 RepID=A0A6A4NRN0_LUPAL|nr:hypothetical protein Lalb_Chr17g0348551 [Lupinus albus]
MDKSKICLSFILLFSFLLSSHVLAYELPETSLTQSSFDSVTQRVLDNGFPSPPEAAFRGFHGQEVVDNGFPSPPEAAFRGFHGQEVVGKSDFSKDIAKARKLGLEYRKLHWGRGWNDNDNPNVDINVNPDFGGINNGGKENQQHEDGKVSKERNPTTSYDLERKRRGDSSMLRFSQRHGYNTPSSQQTGKSDLSKDITEADKLGLENRKWEWKVEIGGGDGRGSNGRGNPSIGNIGGIDNGGWGGDYISTEPMNYKDGRIMRHQNVDKFSELDRQSLGESQATKKFGMKNGGKIYYGGVPRMENTVAEDKKN